MESRAHLVGSADNGPGLAVGEDVILLSPRSPFSRRRNRDVEEASEK